MEFKKTPHVIHTNFEGVRGVDFKLSGIVDVVLAFSPKNFFDIVQALGRGTRDFSKSCEGTILVDQNLEFDCEAENIMEYFKN